MAYLLASRMTDYENAERRRHPAIFREISSSTQLGPYRLDEMYWEQLWAAAAPSRYLELDLTYTSLRDQLASLRAIGPGWDGHRAPAPSARAFDLAVIALETLRSVNAKPSAVLPSADGGVGICFMEGEKYAHLELGNSGEAWVLVYGPKDTPETWQLQSVNKDMLTETWVRISAYIPESGAFRSRESAP